MVLFNVIECRRCLDPFPRSHRAEDLQELEVNALIVLRRALAMTVSVYLCNYLAYYVRNFCKLQNMCTGSVSVNYD